MAEWSLIEPRNYLAFGANCSTSILEFECRYVHILWISAWLSVKTNGMFEFINKTHIFDAISLMQIPNMYVFN